MRRGTKRGKVLSLVPRPRSFSSKQVAVAVKQLEDVIDGLKSGRVTGYALAYNDAGYSRSTSWRARVSRDAYLLLGQLQALATEIASDVNGD